MGKVLLAMTCWSFLSTFIVADSTQAPQGLLILRSPSGYDLGNILFTNLAWTNFYGGIVTDIAGRKSTFADKDISRILYFDAAHYEQLDNDPAEKAFRGGIQTREVVANTAFFNLVSSDALAVQHAQATLETMENQEPAIRPFIEPQISLLKKDILKLESGQVLVTGRWMTQEQASLQVLPKVGDRAATVTFTTKDGKKFENVRIAISDAGVSVMASDGGTTIPFDQLPNDITMFSASIRKQITTCRAALIAIQADTGNQTNAKPAINTASPNSLKSDKDSNRENVTIKDQLLADPFLLDWSDYERDENLMIQIQDFCDKDLPDDVMTALSFIRSRVSSSRFIILNSKGVLIQTQLTTPRFFSFARVVAIKDLSPTDIIQESGQVESFPGQHQTECVLHIYPTLRKHVVQCYPSTPDAEKGKQQASERYQPKYTNAVNITGLDEATNERVAKAFADVITYYGGQKDPSLDQMSTLDELRQFIQDKLNKKAFQGAGEDPEGPISIVFDEKAGRLTMTRQVHSLAGYKKQQCKINIRSLNPDDFTWTKSGDNPSTLTIYGKDIQFEYAGKALQAIDSTELGCSSESDAQDVAQAISRICVQFGWKPSKY